MLEESTGNFSATRNMYDWYQTSTHVIINVMIKNLRESDVRVRLIDETLDVSCSLADGSLFKLHFNLFKPIYVADSNWSVTPSKLEIKLKKTDRKRWQSLEVIPEKGIKRTTAVAGIVHPAGSSPANKKTAYVNNNHNNSSSTNTNGSSVNGDNHHNHHHHHHHQNHHQNDLNMSGQENLNRFATGKPRYDWYQTDAYIVVTVMIRNLTAENVVVDFTEDTAALCCKLAEDTEYTLNLKLYKNINCKESSFKVTTSKVELKMKKAESNRWQHLESEDKDANDQGALRLNQITQTDEAKEQSEEAVVSDAVAQDSSAISSDQNEQNFDHNESESAVVAPVVESVVVSEPTGPAAPTAVLKTSTTVNKGPKKVKDWDKIASEIAKEEEEEAKGGGDSVEDLFRRIYSSSSEETRRAMMKSFTESGGTVLSTNWDEVGRKKTEVKPPEGCEYRQWK